MRLDSPAKNAQPGCDLHKHTHSSHTIFQASLSRIYTPWSHGDVTCTLSVEGDSHFREVGPGDLAFICAGSPSSSWPPYTVGSTTSLWVPRSNLHSRSGTTRSDTVRKDRKESGSNDNLSHSNHSKKSLKCPRFLRIIFFLKEKIIYIYK